MSTNDSPSARKHGRREFLKAGGAVTAALLAPSAAWPITQKDAARAALEPGHARRHAHAQPGQDRLQGRHLFARRPGRAREAEQLRRRRAHHRARARPRRQLPRHFVDLRRARSLERAIRRQSDGPSPQPGLPRHQNQGAHARRLHAHDREVAATAADRPRRPVAAARHRHHDRR